MKYTIEDIFEAIPHRYPFLFVDKIVEIEAEKIKTEKNVTIDEMFFKGHYPGKPIVPGVIICEALFQTGAILLYNLFKDKEEIRGNPIITRVKDIKFKKIVIPGDKLEMEVVLKEELNSVYFLRGKAVVDGKKVILLEFACTLYKE